MALELVKSENFGTVQADIYSDGNRVFMTIDQLARCLEYADKSGVEKIIQRNGYLKNPEFLGTAKLSVPNRNGFSEQETCLFTEDGIYEVTMLSKQPKAREFRAWIREVLKSIRKHGMYAVDELLDNPDLFIQVITELKKEREEKKRLQGENAILEQRVAEYEPKVTYYDTILQSKDVVTVTQIAKDYGLTANGLNDILHEERIQYKNNGQWLLYKDYMNNGFTKSCTHHYTHSDGSKGSRMHTKWTQKGRLMIHSLLEKRGIMADMDKEDEELKGELL